MCYLFSSPSIALWKRFGEQANTLAGQLIPLLLYFILFYFRFYVSHCCPRGEVCLSTEDSRSTSGTLELINLHGEAWIPRPLEGKQIKQSGSISYAPCNFFLKSLWSNVRAHFLGLMLIIIIIKIYQPETKQGKWFTVLNIEGKEIIQIHQELDLWSPRRVIKKLHPLRPLKDKTIKKFS